MCDLKCRYCVFTLWGRVTSFLTEDDLDDFCLHLVENMYIVRIRGNNNNKFQQQHKTHTKTNKQKTTTIKRAMSPFFDKIILLFIRRIYHLTMAWSNCQVFVPKVTKLTLNIKKKYISILKELCILVTDLKFICI